MHLIMMKEYETALLVKRTLWSPSNTLIYLPNSCRMHLIMMKEYETALLVKRTNNPH